MGGQWQSDMTPSMGFFHRPPVPLASAECRREIPDPSLSLKSTALAGRWWKLRDGRFVRGL
jgi:hypothetical protein